MDQVHLIDHEPTRDTKTFEYALAGELYLYLFIGS